MDRKRWYKLGLKQLKSKVSRNFVKEKKILKVAEGDMDSDEGDEEEDIDDSDGEDDVHTGNGELFGYIDDSGAVVYIQLDEEAEENSIEEEFSNALQIKDNYNGHSVHDAIAPNNAEPLESKAAFAPTEDEFPHGNMVEDIEVEEEISKLKEAAATLEGLEKSLQPCARINPSILIRYGGICINSLLQLIVLCNTLLEGILFSCMVALQNMVILKLPLMIAGH